ncbi:MAG: radical SAM family heme chaperone HemW [Cyanobacteriota bacterium]|nr:radical SAM family heme chaperone HemW [Cyanobacteriota bacterium]
MKAPAPRSAYLHIPFCHRRCFYCDFPVVPLGDRADGAAGPGSTSIHTYLAQLLEEIATSPIGPPLSTVYVGGGTPSLLSPPQVAALLAALHRRYGLADGAEITLELDPAGFDQQRLADLLDLGVNRVSFGAQSFDDGVLAGLGRRHRRSHVLEAADWLEGARRQGRLRSWSLDLLQGLPGQGPTAWLHQLQQALALEPPHVSVYDLIIEPGTVFERWLEQGRLVLPDGDQAADLLAITANRLAAAGYGRYEISNWARPGHACRHNRVYWSGADWWAFGLGATSALGGRRLARPRTREGYRHWLASGAAARQAAGDGLPLEDRLLVGLRRREGVPMNHLARQYGLGPEALARLRARLKTSEEQGLLLVEGGRWRLSDPEGLALSNGVLREILNWCAPG